jgi:hypothetical protein
VGPLIDRFFNLFKRDMVSFDISCFLNLKEEAVNKFRSKFLVLTKQKKPIAASFRKFLKEKETFFIDT